MKILIIGGIGNIGFSITKKLIKDNKNEIYVLTRNKHKESELCNSLNIIYGDGNNENYLKELQNRYNFEIVVNLVIQQTEQAELNIKVFRDKIKQFFFFSSATVYNHEKNVVLTEESETFNKNSEYSQRKLKCENIFLKAFKDYNFPCIIIRPTQTYSGKRIPLSIKGKECWTVIQRIKNEKGVIIHGDGTSAWVCTHSDDFADGFCGLIAKDKAIGEIFHITSDEVVNWNIIYNIIAEELNVNLKPVYIPANVLEKSVEYNFHDSIKGDKQYSVIFDNTKIKSFVPSFKCKISIREGIKKYIQYLKEHKELQFFESDFDSWCDKMIESYSKAIDSIKSKY